MIWTRSQVEEITELCRDRINEGVARDLMCRLADEEPPNDTRHLTDTRTRVSTLLEYALGYEINEVLREQGGGYWSSCVLWNVFPDLLLRDAVGTVKAGLEVKALHTAAEEKSANLSTPLSKIRGEGDYLIIMNWGWDRNSKAGSDARYPHVYSIDVFDAHLLARIRDFTWLKNQGGRVKGIDCSTPMISAPDDSNIFKAEEGNLGKLMRIRLDSELPEGFPEKERLEAEAERFKNFQDRIFGMALTTVFKEVCLGIGASDITTLNISAYPVEPKKLGHCKLRSESTLTLWAGTRLESNLQGIQSEDRDIILWLGSKLAWKVYVHLDGHWSIVDSGTKAENSIAFIDDAIRRYG